MVAVITIILEACPCAAITTLFAIKFGHDQKLAVGAVTLPPLIIPPDNAFYYIIISPASNARQGSVIMLINVDKVTAPTASFWS